MSSTTTAATSRYSAFEGPGTATSTAHSLGRSDGRRGTFRAATAALSVVSAMTIFVPATTGSPHTAATIQNEINRGQGVAAVMAQRSLLIRQVLQLERFGSGWAAPGSLGPSKSALEGALAFVDYLSQVELREPPRINLSSDGEINFFWSSDIGVLDFGVNRRGKGSYFARLSDGREFLGDLPRISHNVLDPDILRVLLSR